MSYDVCLWALRKDLRKQSISAQQGGISLFERLSQLNQENERFITDAERGHLREEDGVSSALRLGWAKFLLHTYKDLVHQAMRRKKTDNQQVIKIARELYQL